MPYLLARNVPFLCVTLRLLQCAKLRYTEAIGCVGEMLKLTKIGDRCLAEGRGLYVHR
jgi:hypothetical protein